MSYYDIVKVYLVEAFVSEYTVNLEMFASFLRQISRLPSFVKIKPSRNRVITLSFLLI